MSLGPGFWGSANFWQPPRRSWPYAPTKLEQLATRAGISDDELRQLLMREIERRRAESLPSTAKF